MATLTAFGCVRRHGPSKARPPRRAPAREALRARAARPRDVACRPDRAPSGGARVGRHCAASASSPLASFQRHGGAGSRSRPRGPSNDGCAGRACGRHLAGARHRHRASSALSPPRPVISVSGAILRAARTAVRLPRCRQPLLAIACYRRRDHFRLPAAASVGNARSADARARTRSLETSASAPPTLRARADAGEEPLALVDDLLVRGADPVPPGAPRRALRASRSTLKMPERLGGLRALRRELRARV